MGFLGDATSWLGDQLGFTNPLDSIKLDQGAFSLPGFSSQYDTYGRLAADANHRRAPRASAFTARDQGQFRGQQGALANMLMQQAQGRGPGQQLVRMQAQNMADRAVAQAAGGARNANPQMAALAGRNAAMAGANAQSQVGGQAAQAGLQAQLGATSQLGDVLGTGRQQDQALSMFNAGQQQNSSQFNTDARMRQMGMNDARQLELLRQRLATSQMQQQGQMGYQNARVGLAGAQAQVPSFFDKALGGAAAIAPFAFGK